MFCAGYQYGDLRMQDACTMDSGGPLGKVEKSQIVLNLTILLT